MYRIPDADAARSVKRNGECERWGREGTQDGTMAIVSGKKVAPANNNEVKGERIGDIDVRLGEGIYICFRGNKCFVQPPAAYIFRVIAPEINIVGIRAK